VDNTKRVEAYDYGVDEKYIPTYVEYYALDRSKQVFPDDGREYMDHSTDRWLLAHQDFYDDVYLGITDPNTGKPIHQPIDRIENDKVASESFEKWYNSKYLLLPIGSARKKIRAQNPKMDSEGARLEFWKPYTKDQVKMDASLEKMYNDFLGAEAILDEPSNVPGFPTNRDLMNDTMKDLDRLLAGL
jgi:hypothetical protein